MGRIGELDLPDRLAPAVPAWATSLVIGLAAAAAAGVVRFTLDWITPGVAAFALIFPAVTVATLFARWQAGLWAAAIAVAYTWFIFYPTRVPVAGAAPAMVSLISVCIALLINIALTDLFRRAVRRATAERDRELADRDLFLEEFDHRVKNNFTLVASLLEMQRRRAGDGPTAEALGAALARVESIARAHRHLYRGGSTPGTVDMTTYLGELSTALADSLFLRGAITLDCRAEHAALPRDRAVSIGLVINELVTNAAKHAFAGRDEGHISVVFGQVGNGWQLVVADNGAGISDTPKPERREGGLGQRLVDAFARQARGTVTTESGPGGTTVTVVLES
jgi:two-component sensor histidine kinase